MRNLSREKQLERVVFKHEAIGRAFQMQPRPRFIQMNGNLHEFRLSEEACIHATKQCREYCHFRLTRYNRTPTWVTEKDNFVEDVIKQIQAEKISLVKLHRHGDFYSDKYYQKWIRIAKACPETHFFAFTHNHEIDFSLAPDNLKLFYSVDSAEQPMNPTARYFGFAVFKTNPNPRHEHLEAIKVGSVEARVCASSCDKCQACWLQKFNIAFIYIKSSNNVLQANSYNNTVTIFQTASGNSKPIKQHPVRRKIAYLLATGPASNSFISELVGIEEHEIDKHANVLEKQGLLARDWAPEIGLVWRLKMELVQKIINRLIDNVPRDRDEMVASFNVPRTTLLYPLQGLVRLGIIKKKTQDADEGGNRPRGRPRTLWFIPEASGDIEQNESLEIGEECVE